jgi:beta-aspartyl-peptidase (threonine type)
MKLVLAKSAADKVAGGKDPQTSADESISQLEKRLNGHGGIILLDARGRFGIAHNTPKMAWGVRMADGERWGTRIGG